MSAFRNKNKCAKTASYSVVNKKRSKRRRENVGKSGEGRWKVVFYSSDT
jgi:hypothetical protein